MKRYELMDLIQEIQDRNYNKFVGVNEADLATREEIADLWEKEFGNVSEHLCQYESDNTTAMNCKHCGEPKRSTKHYVMPRLFVITAQEGWNEMFWDREKAQHKIDTQYKKDFPNDEFWIEEVNVS